MALIPVAVLLLLCGAVLWYLKSVRGSDVDNGSRIYYAGSKVDIPDNSSLEVSDDDKKTYLLHDGTESEISLPIYSGDDTEITLPVSMVYYAPRSGLKGRLTYFSKVWIEGAGGIAASHGNKERVLDPGFLFDGKDLYVFLEPVTLSLNGYTLQLPPLSYVEAVPNQNITVFNRETKEFVTESPSTPVIARDQFGNYSMSLLSDSMEVAGAKKLLFSEPDLLDPIV